MISDSLNFNELQDACRIRGMQCIGVSEDLLKSQLNMWMDLSTLQHAEDRCSLLVHAMVLLNYRPPLRQLLSPPATLLPEQAKE